MERIVLPAICLLFLTAFTPIYGQKVKNRVVNPARFSPAHGELILRKVAVEAEIFDLRQKFTEESLPVIRKIRELQIIKREMKTMAATKKFALPGLNETYGKLVLEKVSTETNFFNLRDSLTDDNPQIKTARYKLQLIKQELAAWFK